MCIGRRGRSILTVAAIWMSASTTAADVQRYAIDPGGAYVYLPSPFVGIPGGKPSAYELDFGVGGFVSVAFDSTAGIAGLFDVDILLTGNEPVQASPPLVAPVTANRVADWLEARQFELSALYDGLGDAYDAVSPQDLRLIDLPSGVLTLAGGYNATFVDGDGMMFALSATPIPEPATVWLFGAVAIAARRRR